MGSINKSRLGFPSHHHAPSFICTRTHQIGALALILSTFFLTRLIDHHRPLPASSLDYASADTSQAVNVGSSRGGFLWPDRGYGSRLDVKIYVYKEDEIDGLRELMRGRDGMISADSCVKGQWGTQVKIHQFLLQSRFRTLKKEDADLFFVPTYVKCVRMMGGLNDKEINRTYVKVLSQMPYFRKSGGRDHIFVFPSGAGAHLFRSWATYLNRSIILTPEGDRTDKRDTSAFNTWKDIIIPGNIDDGMTRADGDILVQPLPLSERKYLANYLGRAQGKVGRLQLMELAKQFPDKLESPELKFKGPDKLGRSDYFLHLRNAKFCLSPRGESSWTLRFFESFFVECVPVILSDQVELPFQNVIDYTQISIKWPSTRISSEFLDYLQSIPETLMDGTIKFMLMGGETCISSGPLVIPIAELVSLQMHPSKSYLTVADYKLLKWASVALFSFSDQEIERMIASGRKIRCLWVYAPDSASCSAMQGIMWELQRKVRRFHQSTETFWLHDGSIVNRNLVRFQDWKPPMPLP